MSDFDSSPYADSAQARQLDRDLEALRNPVDTGQRRAFETTPEQRQAQAEREARNDAARKLRLLGALKEMEAFFGPPVTRNAEGIIVSK